MSWLYRRVVRPILFAQDSEKIHDRTLGWLGRAAHSTTACDLLHRCYGADELPVELFGLKFPNPIGVAAGLDKFGRALPAWPALGFGFCELGGVTLHAQPGNPAPRLFRAVDDEALVNRMGFNNPGADALAVTLAQWRQSGLWPTHPVGINLGKSKTTPLAEAAADYTGSFIRLRDHADFFVINISSPNTPQLRQLQDKSALNEILTALKEANSGPRPLPLLVKIAPDLSLTALDEILELALAHGLAGIVATNTTVERPNSTSANTRRVYEETGGLSGRPLRVRSTELIRHSFRQTKGALPIIGVGGIFSAEDAWEKIQAGASLLQIYTGLIYRGPGLVKEIVAGLRAHLARQGITRLADAVGGDTKF